MRYVSIWWAFLFLFALTLGGVHSLGWWTRTLSAQEPVSAGATTYTARCQPCETMYWRALILNQ